MSASLYSKLILDFQILIKIQEKCHSGAPKDMKFGLSGMVMDIDSSTVTNGILLILKKHFTRVKMKHT